MNWTKTGKWLTTVAAALTLAACSNGGDSSSEDSAADTGADTATEETTEETTDNSSEGEASEEESSDDAAASGDFDTSASINVISREEGSGTRDAFTEITGIVDENDVDLTSPEATIQNSTGAVLSTVAGDPTAIGYISLGSLDDTVKAVNIEGVEATPENIQAEEYPIYRPFNVAYKGELSAEAQDFYNFIFSPEAQDIVEEQGFIAISEDQQAEYTADESASGEVTISGSTSVEPAMQAIADAYQEQNPNVTVNIQANGSGAGMQDTIDGANDIGMASRELSEEEAGQLESQPMALDGIAVVVHTDNPTEELTVDQVKQIFTGEITTWDEVSA